MSALLDEIITIASSQFKRDFPVVCGFAASQLVVEFNLHAGQITKELGNDLAGRVVWRQTLSHLFVRTKSALIGQPSSISLVTCFGTWTVG